MRDKSDNDTELSQGESYYLEPGYIYFTRSSATIRTVVANCVAVCLWDRTLKYGGMNHFLRPFTRDRKDATACFGNIATSTLVRIMEEAGCKRQDIVAQIFGGGMPGKSDQDNIGKENIRVAREVLARKDIFVISQDVGGKMGRKIIFDTSTGETVVMKVHNVRESDWISK